ncbi:MAG: ABC transporter permease, partial [Candidatus Bipolaricaulota bacterium]|nr:ABC transporter permease [Candidatus Bipolaricaulota bacterium]
ILVFLTMHLAPGDPVKIILGPRATQQAIDRLRHELGLDRPFVVQYFTWVGNILKGNWGRSIQLRREVFPLVMSRFGFTAILAFTAIFIASLGGVAAGLGAAFKPHTFWDRTFTFFAILGFSVPAFWLGLLLQLVFGLKLGWFPVSGVSSSTGGGALDFLHHMVLPSIALAAEPMALIGRMTRSSLLEVAQEDYIKTARAKGVTERAVLAKHALKSAFIPVLTVIGMQLGFVLAGSVFVEVIFSWPGIGALMVNGILARDFPLVQGAILIIALSYVFVNLGVDLLYAYINPTIRYE